MDDDDDVAVARADRGSADEDDESGKFSPNFFSSWMLSIYFWPSNSYANPWFKQNTVDEDFQADSESDVAEEYDSAHESSGTDSDAEDGGGGDDDADEDEDMDDAGTPDGAEPVKKKAKTK